MEHFDVLVIGAGLSGIDAAHHLQELCPKKSYAVLEQRGAIGGTWDLFRYPGVRSDSDMFTMSYGFRPWKGPRALSPGSEIREYVQAVARDEGIDRHIKFHHQIKRASWSTPEAKWTVEAEQSSPDGTKKPVTLTCNFLFSCAGYYQYSQGYTPDFPGIETFKGKVVHPQAWPQDLDYAGKRVVIIGSGATAVTLVPGMAATAGHVTMLQRSPTYIVSRPGIDTMANRLRKVLPAKMAHHIARFKNIAFSMYVFLLAQKKPDYVKGIIRKQVVSALGPDYDVDTHFNPHYKPWEQRLCLVPDGDLFAAVKSGAASIVTDKIDRMTPNGIRLQSGKELEADIIVTATGLVMRQIGGMELSVDGKPIETGKTLSYKGMMMSGVPNFANIFGYINASWTLKADLICTYVCRLINYMDKKSVKKVVPISDSEVPETSFIANFSSGYIQRGLATAPKQGTKKPWRVHQNYILDLISLGSKQFNNGALKFSSPGSS